MRLSADSIRDLSWESLSLSGESYCWPGLEILIPVDMKVYCPCGEETFDSMRISKPGHRLRHLREVPADYPVTALKTPHPECRLS